MRALNLLRSSIHYRKEAFDKGLQAAGYALRDVQDPKPGDLLIIWNRYAGNDERARQWEKAGAQVAVVENGWLGKGWRGGEWFTVCLGHHSGAGRWVDHGPARWDGWGVDLGRWRQGRETLILGQRGIGEPGISSPDRWAEKVQAKIGGRIRPHPGKEKPARTLEDDLENAWAVITWNSGAALVALASGVPVFYDFDRWIGATASKPLAHLGEPMMDDESRLMMFQRLAWSMWTLGEIESGQPFALLRGR